MKQDHIKDLLPGYLDGELDAAQGELVEEHLQVCTNCEQELLDLKILLEAFKEEKEIEPSVSVRVNFNRMLEEEKSKISEETKVIPIAKEKKSYTLRSFLKIAAVVSLLLCSYLLGKFHQEEKSENLKTESSPLENRQNEMFALLENTSASKRIQGVNYFEDLEDPDEEIIQALKERMFNDENKNVRLTAVEALGKFTSSETVKNGLIMALEKEKDPVIQIAIIQILVKIQEKKAVEPMKQLLEKEATEPFVKEQIKALLPSIT